MPSERPPLIDRIIERVLYPNPGGNMPGPLAGRTIQVDMTRLQPNEGRSFLLTHSEKKLMEAVGLVALAYLSTYAFMKK